MAPPVRKLPESYELAVGFHRGHKVAKHRVEKPLKQRPSRLPSVNFILKFNINSNYLINKRINF